MLRDLALKQGGLPSGREMSYRANASMVGDIVSGATSMINLGNSITGGGGTGGYDVTDTVSNQSSYTTPTYNAPQQYSSASFANSFTQSGMYYDTATGTWRYR